MLALYSKSSVLNFAMVAFRKAVLICAKVEICEGSILEDCAMVCDNIAIVVARYKKSCVSFLRWWLCTSSFGARRRSDLAMVDFDKTMLSAGSAVCDNLAIVVSLYKTSRAPCDCGLIIQEEPRSI